MNRHPALVARMASTLQIASGGRLILGIGIGGAPKEHAAYGIDFPAGARAGRPARGGRRGHPGAVDRRAGHARLAVLPADARPTPTRCRTRRRRSSSVARPPAGARLAGRIGDGWSAFDDNFEQNLPLYLESLEAAGRRREDQRVIVGFQGDWLGDESIDASPWVQAPRETWERWQAAGADGAIVLARTTADVDALVEATGRW